MDTKQMLAALVASASLYAAGAAHAAIRYQVVDLADAPGAPDTMQLIYRIDDAFAAGTGFNLLYSPDRYADLQVTVPLGDSWFSSVTQPDGGAPFDGIVSYLALADSPAAVLTFTVTFTHVGTLPPGAQPYELFDASFNVIGGGVTSPVPELPMTALLAGGLPLLAWLSRHGRRRSASLQ